jgi:CheY-like chemotaxis protein
MKRICSISWKKSCCALVIGSSANDGEQALEVYQRHNASIDVVLLDIGLPKIAGGDVLRKMRQQNPAVKVAVGSRGEGRDLRGWCPTFRR